MSADSAKFLPPGLPASLYFGKVMHARLKPVGHRFIYHVFSLLIDVDQLDAAHRASRWFSIGRFNLLSFCPRDHGGEDGAELRRHVEEMLAATGKNYDRILLLCYPRMFGFVFNPISVYYCYTNSSISALIYEVRNTFGQKHSYVAPVRDGELGPSGVRQQRDKLFHVSPFMDMAMVYRFRLQPPTASIALHILECDAQGPMLAATFAGKQRDLNTPAVLAAFFGLPLMTLKIVAGIHWQALRLWLKGMKLRSLPPAPGPSSWQGDDASSPQPVQISQLQARQ